MPSNPVTNVIPLARPTEDVLDPGPALHGRVRLASRILAVVLTGLAIGLVVAAGSVMLAMLVYRGEAVQIGATGMWLGFGGDQPPAGYVAFSSLRLDQRIVYVLVGIVRTAPAVMVMLNLAGLFRLYGRGIIFSRDNALRIRAVGLWLVADAAAPLAMHLLLSATGYEIDRNWMHLASLQALVVGAIVIIVAEVMKVGARIEDERSQYV